MSTELIMTLLVEIAILPFLYFPPFFLFQKLLTKATSGLNYDWLAKKDLFVQRTGPVVNCLQT